MLDSLFAPLKRLIRRKKNGSGHQQPSQPERQASETPHDNQQEAPDAIDPVTSQDDPAQEEEADTTPRTDRFGLFPNENEKPWFTKVASSRDRSYNLDIVAVHGITGDAYDTWTDSSGRFWLKDFLPDDLPGSRVFSYGYDADVFFTKANGNLDTYARTLLVSLRQILPQDAIINSILSAGIHGDIQRRTCGIVFLGTPHRGSKQTPFPSLLTKIANVGTPILSRFIGTSRTELIDSLKDGSRELETLSSQFVNQTPRFKIASFIEQNVTAPASERIVDGITGIVGCAGEDIIDMQGCDHRTICRFAAKDNNYRLIRDVLRSWAREATGRDRRVQQEDDSDDLINKIKDTLQFEGMDWRRLDLADTAMTNTCSWVFENTSFKEWLDAPTGPLWIKGKPGAGKSTLMETIVRHYEEAPDVIVLFFFFVGFGYSQGQLRRSPQGLYRTLLYQLIEQAPGAVSELREFFRRQFRTHERADTQFEWHSHGSKRIRDFLNKGLRKLVSLRQPIRVFVDAIDEAHPGTAEDLAMYLDQLDDTLRGLGLDFRVCISSRHFPINYVKEKHRIVVEKENSKDIETYILNQFERRLILTLHTFDTHEPLDELQRRIINQSNGNFLWVNKIMPSVVYQLNRAPEQLTPVYAALQEVPPELGTIYSDMLSNIIQPLDRYDAYMLLRWATDSDDPMLIRQLYADVQFTDAYSLPSNTSREDFRRHLLNTDIRLGRLSGGLMECLDNVESPTAAFIHCSVRGFLSNTGLSLLGSMIDSPPASATPSDSFDGSSRRGFRDSLSNRDGSMAAEPSVTEQGTPVNSTDQDSNEKSPVDDISIPDRPLPAQASRVSSTITIASHTTEQIIRSDRMAFDNDSLLENAQPPMDGSRHTSITRNPNLSIVPAPSHQSLSAKAFQTRLNVSQQWFRRYDEFCAPHFLTFASASERIKIAILDTGLDLGSPFISPASRNFKDFWIPDDSSSASDSHGHGTHVASLVLKMAPSADIYIAKIADSPKATYSPRIIAEAIENAVLHWDVDIISMSFGFSRSFDRDFVLRDALKLVGEKKKVIFMSPAFDEQARDERGRFLDQLEVTPIYSTDGYGNYSSFNPRPSHSRNNFAVLGEDISLSELTGIIPHHQTESEKLKFLKGTSFATPIAAGIAALVLGFARENASHLTRESIELLKGREGIETILKYMSTSRSEFDYIVPWKLFNKDTNDLGIARKFNVILAGKLNGRRQQTFLRRLPNDEPRKIEELDDADDAKEAPSMSTNGEGVLE